MMDKGGKKVERTTPPARVSDSDSVEERQTAPVVSNVDQEMETGESQAAVSIPRLPMTNASRAICDFLLDIAANNQGVMRRTIFSYDNKQLEEQHNYIQFLLPNNTPSGTRAGRVAPQVDAATITEFHHNPQLRAAFLEGFDLMMEFWGLRRFGDTVTAIDLSKMKNYVWTKPKGDHNQARITRAIESANLLISPELARSLQQTVVEIGQNVGMNRTTLSYWQNAIAGQTPIPLPQGVVSSSLRAARTRIEPEQPTESEPIEELTRRLSESSTTAKSYAELKLRLKIARAVIRINKNPNTLKTLSRSLAAENQEIKKKTEERKKLQQQWREDWQNLSFWQYFTRTQEAQAYRENRTFYQNRIAVLNFDINAASKNVKTLSKEKKELEKTLAQLAALTDKLKRQQTKEDTHRANIFQRFINRLTRPFRSEPFESIAPTKAELAFARLQLLLARDPESIDEYGRQNFIKYRHNLSLLNASILQLRLDLKNASATESETLNASIANNLSQIDNLHLEVNTLLAEQESRLGERRARKVTELFSEEISKDNLFDLKQLEETKNHVTASLEQLLNSRKQKESLALQIDEVAVENEPQAVSMFKELQMLQSIESQKELQLESLLDRGLILVEKMQKEKQVQLQQYQRLSAVLKTDTTELSLTLEDYARFEEGQSNLEKLDEALYVRKQEAKAAAETYLALSLPEQNTENKKIVEAKNIRVSELLAEKDQLIKQLEELKISSDKAILQERNTDFAVQQIDYTSLFLSPELKNNIITNVKALSDTKKELEKLMRVKKHKVTRLSGYDQIPLTELEKQTLSAELQKIKLDIVNKKLERRALLQTAEELIKAAKNSE